mmetsp:Transcript_18387/g.41868  ORF Transcript_18387/g.41868 Transcript_18387/m.41868 type:complete len:145 (-) Transcript_18387:77-511(-)
MKGCSSIFVETLMLLQVGHSPRCLTLSLQEFLVKMFVEIVDNIFKVCFPNGKNAQDISVQEPSQRDVRQAQGQTELVQDDGEIAEVLDEGEQDDQRQNFITDEEMLQEEEEQRKLLKIENIVNIKRKMNRRLQQVRRLSRETNA